MTELLDFFGHGSYSQPHTAPTGRQVGCEGTTAGSADGYRNSVAGPQSHDSPARRPGKGSPRTENAPGAAAGGVLIFGANPGFPEAALRGAREPALALGLDRREVLVVERPAETVGDRHEQTARDEDPRLREMQDAGAMPADRNVDAEAWILIAGSLLVSVADRLGGPLGAEDFAAIKTERRRWLTGAA